VIYIAYVLGYMIAMFATSFAITAAFILLEGEVTEERKIDNQNFALWCGAFWPVTLSFIGMFGLFAIPMLGVWTAGKMIRRRRRL
jgi:hypothetical protein